MSTFSETLRRAQSGDCSAIARLYESHRGVVERTVRRGLGRALGGRVEVDDICQSVFGDMLRELTRLDDRGERSFQGWLITKTRNKIRMKARRASLKGGRRREERLTTEVGGGLVTDSNAPPEEASAREEAGRLSRLLGTLEPEQREVLGLVVDERLSWSEVAARIGAASPDAARMRYVRALALLRDRWTPG